MSSSTAALGLPTMSAVIATLAIWFACLVAMAV